LSQRTVVFDVDDTLYLERDYVRSGFHAVGAWIAEREGIANFFEIAMAKFEAGFRGRIFNSVLEELGAVPEPALIAALVAEYRRHVPSIELLPDAVAALEQLAGAASLAVVTDGPVDSQRAKVEALHLERWADPIVLTAELGAEFGKPHPAAFELIEDAHGHAAQQCVYVADNPSKDFAGPKGLGWRTVRIRRAGGLHWAMASDGAVDDEISTLESLAAVLGATR
jgi:putative hydrolase of the HAD superfamily